MGLFTKTRTKRIVPEERKFANAMLVREAMRRLTGIEGEGDIRARQFRRGRALRDVEVERRAGLRALGERGIEGPGAYNRLIRSGEGALGSLIAADTQADIARRTGAESILGTLLRENQPYTKTRTKTGALAKAKPFLKVGGAVLGGVLGGPGGAAVGSKAGEAVGGLGDEPGGPGAGATQFSGAGGSTTVPPTGTNPPGTTPAPLGRAPIGTQDVEEGGGGAIRPPREGGEGGILGYKKGLGTKRRLTGGLEGLLGAFGG